jgi:hypothetical protein
VALFVTPGERQSEKEVNTVEAELGDGRKETDCWCCRLSQSRNFPGLSSDEVSVNSSFENADLIGFYTCN